jgi:hypothetical protein
MTKTLQNQIDHLQACGTVGAPPCLRHSEVERLKARLASQGPIEQAKGILMAREGCDPDQAFDILRRASQRTNTPVRDLARRIAAAASRADDPQTVGPDREVIPEETVRVRRPNLP